MAFAKEMLDIKNRLEQSGHVCYLPEGTEAYAGGQVKHSGGSEGAKLKIANDLIRKHYDLIKTSDAILILNYDKNGVKNYIGGNAFLEMGFAHILGKVIYLLNPLPDIDFIHQEIEAMQPIVLNGELNRLSNP
ncbi:hypothetical protein C4546_03320 [Candidatus Parcubacteria bacterium]|nr:MAG: hypothetical protein C4546_03320 [Candidatus Parcubacteria bacterium]